MFAGHGHCPQSGLLQQKKNELPSSFLSSGIRSFFVVGATHRMTMTYI